MVSRDLVPAELEDVHRRLPLAVAVLDRVLDDPEVTFSAHPTRLERQISGIDPTPFSKVLDAFEAFARLRELEHRIVVVDLVGDVLIGGGELSVPPQQRESFLVIHPLRSPSRSALVLSSAERTFLVIGWRRR